MLAHNSGGKQAWTLNLLESLRFPLYGAGALPSEVVQALTTLPGHLPPSLDTRKVGGQLTAAAGVPGCLPVHLAALCLPLRARRQCLRAWAAPAAPALQAGIALDGPGRLLPPLPRSLPPPPSHLRFMETQCLTLGPLAQQKPSRATRRRLNRSLAAAVLPCRGRLLRLAGAFGAGLARETTPAASRWPAAPPLPPYLKTPTIHPPSCHSKAPPPPPSPTCSAVPRHPRAARPPAAAAGRRGHRQAGRPQEEEGSGARV